MVRRTSAQAYGQVYVPAINWIAMRFRLSRNRIRFLLKPGRRLRVAVSLDMTITTILLAIAVSTVWKWAPWKIIGVILVFLPLDLSFRPPRIS